MPEKLHHPSSHDCGDRQIDPEEIGKTSRTPDLSLGRQLTGSLTAIQSENPELPTGNLFTMILSPFSRFIKPTLFFV